MNRRLGSRKRKLQKGRMERTETGTQGGEGGGIKRGRIGIKAGKNSFAVFLFLSAWFLYLFLLIFVLFFLCLKNQYSIYRHSREKEWRGLRQNTCN